MEHPSSKPLYERLYEHVRRDIESGAIKAGERLPSKRALAAHLNISVTTVENAYDRLYSEGFIFSKPASGFFAAIDPPSAPIPQRADDSEREGRVGDDSPGRIAPPVQHADDDGYDMDFHGNDKGLRMFPISVWTKLMRQVLSDVNVGMLRTVPWNGLYPLRSAIADYLRRYKGIKANPDLIVIGAGTEYLYSRLLPLFGSQAILGFEDPGYQKLAHIAAKMGIPQQFVPVDDEGLSVEWLQNSPANAVHLSPSNHFPTGAVMPVERRRALVNWAAADRYRFIIEDDYDSEFSYHRRNIPTLYSMDSGQKVVYMNTFSKSLVPSLRISYMLLPPSLHHLYLKSQDFYSCTVSSFEQMALAQFLEKGHFERHLNRLQTYYRKKRDSLYAALAESRFSLIADLHEHSAGTHMQIHVRTNMNDEEIRRKAEGLNVHISLLSDYCQFACVRTARTLVLNYAGMSREDIGRAVMLLEMLFQDDLAQAERQAGKTSAQARATDPSN